MRWLLVAIVLCWSSLSAAAQQQPPELQTQLFVVCSNQKAMETVVTKLQQQQEQVNLTKILREAGGKAKLCHTRLLGPVAKFKVVKKYELHLQAGTFVEAWTVRVSYKGGPSLYVLFNRTVGQNA